MCHRLCSLHSFVMHSMLASTVQSPILQCSDPIYILYLQTACEPDHPVNKAVLIMVWLFLHPNSMIQSASNPLLAMVREMQYYPNVWEKCNNMFSSYIFKIPFIALHLSHCPLIYLLFFFTVFATGMQKKVLNRGLKEEKVCWGRRWGR